MQALIADKQKELAQVLNEVDELAHVHNELRQRISAQDQTLERLRLDYEALTRELETQGTFTTAPSAEDQKETGGLETVSAEDNEQEMQLRQVREEQSDTAGPHKALDHDLMAPGNNNEGCTKEQSHDSG